MKANCKSAVWLATVVFAAFSGYGQTITFSAAAGEITRPFVLTNNYLSQPVLTDATNGGRAVYTFTVSRPGKYKVEAQVRAPNDPGHSFYVSIDSEPQDPEAIWDIAVTNGFGWQVVSWRGVGETQDSQAPGKVFELAAGTHKLIVKGREPGTELQAIIVEPVVEPPTGLVVTPGPTAQAPAPPRNLRIVPGP